MYYFAYGSNLNTEQMAIRCPDAEVVGKLILPKARLVFRGVADVEYDDDQEVQGGLWKITKRCERALDRYEGVKNGLYRKEYITVQVIKDGEPVARRALVYRMNRTHYAMPSDHYVGTIRKGYCDFGLDLAALRAAITVTAMTRRLRDFHRASEIEVDSCPF